MKKSLIRASTTLLALSVSLGVMQPLPAAQAATTTSTTTTTYKFSGTSAQAWQLDEARNTLYVATTNSLLILNPQDLTVQKTLPTAGSATDLDLSLGRLYLTTNGQVQVFDTTTQTLVNTFPITGTRIAVDHETIFSTDTDQWQQIHTYNMTTGARGILADTTNNNSYYHTADLAVDPVRHTLYIGQTGMSGCEIDAFSTTTLKPLSRSTYANFYGFPFPQYGVLVEGDSVYYAGRRLNADNLADISGTYNGNESVRFVQGNYVYTNNAVYDKDLFAKVAELPVDSDLVLADASGALLYYDRTANAIKRGPLTKQLPANDAAVYGLTDWVLDETNGLLHGISAQTGKLYDIRTRDLKILRETVIGSQPTDIELLDGKLYIALFGSTQVAVVDAKTSQVQQKLTVLTNPYKIELDGKKLYYVSEDQHNPLYAYDMTFGGNKRISFRSDYDTFYEPDLYLDREKGLLYIGESGLSGSVLYELNTADMKPVSNFDGYGFPYAQRNVTGFGDDVYFAGARFKERDVVSTHAVGYSGNVLYADGPYLFTDKAIVDRDSGKTIAEFPFTVAAAAMDSNGYAYISVANTGKMYRFNPTTPDELFTYYPTDLQGSWATDTLSDFVQADLLKGYLEENGSYSIKPDNNITRAEFIALLIRTLGLETNQPGKSFADVPRDAWFFDSVRIASALGLTDGVDAQHFAPERTIQRDEAAAFLIRAFESSLGTPGTGKSFADVPAYWASRSIAKASQFGIINGYEDGTFHPQNAITRAETVTMLSNALNKQSSALASDDDLLIQTAIDNELAYYRAVRIQDFPAAYQANDRYTTGFQHAFGSYGIAQFENLRARNFQFTIELTGEFSGTVVHKSNNFAVVKLSGAAYAVSKSRGAFSSTSDQTADALVYLKKDRTSNTWKVYRSDLQ